MVTSPAPRRSLSRSVGATLGPAAGGRCQTLILKAKSFNLDSGASCVVGFCSSQMVTFTSCNF